MKFHVPASTAAPTASAEIAAPIARRPHSAAPKRDVRAQVLRSIVNLPHFPRDPGLN